MIRNVNKIYSIGSIDTIPQTPIMFEDIHEETLNKNFK